jgi:hypothetical protein
MTSRDHARRLMLILLANDRTALRLAQDGPTAHRAPRRDDQGRARRGGDARRDTRSREAEALAHAA